MHDELPPPLPPLPPTTRLLPVIPAASAEPVERDDKWQQRKERLIAMRGISIPTAIVRRFFQIDGIRMAMLMAFNLFISIIPLMILAFALVSQFRERIQLSTVFVEQFHLRGETALIVRGAFPRTSNIIKVASAIAVVSFAISGFDVAAVFQRTFADAWQVKRIRGWRGPVRGGIWFILVFLTFAFGQLLQRGPARYGVWAYGISVPIVAVMNYWFWKITPRLLLDKQLASRDLRPGAILGMIGSTALWVASLLILPGWFGWYGRGFGGVGIALAMLSWTYVVAIVWVIIVVISAITWERSASIDEVTDLTDADELPAPTAYVR